MAPSCHLLKLLPLLTVAGVLCQLPGCCVAGASNVPHHISKKDLHIDLSVPSLGVLLSQRLQRKASSQQELPQRSQWRSQYDGAPSDEKRDGGDSSADQGESTTEERTTVRTHRGRFGQDMTAKTSAVTLPAEHDHESIAPEQSIVRRWKNLMEPREPLPADLVPDSTRTPPKLKRSDDATTSPRTENRPEGSKRSATRDYAIANATESACNCSELLSNETVSKVFYLVPPPLETSGQNGSLIKEIIRASLSKSVLVERLYDKGCRCSCNHTSLAPIPASSSAKTRPTTAETTKATPTTVPCTASASTSTRLQEDRPQTLCAPRTTASSSRGTKCPTRVFVKFPGEDLPARATDCRKLWLPDSVYKGESFWECEDRGSADCGGGRVVTTPSSTERTFLAPRASNPLPSSQGPQNAVYARPSAWYSTRRRTAQPTATTNRAETAASTKTVTSTAKRTVSTTPSKCGNAKDEDASPGAPEKKAHNQAAYATVTSPNETAGGWHLSLIVPFYPFGGNKTGNATLPSTRAPMPENLRHRHYMTSRTTATTAKKTSARRLTPTSISQTSGTTSSILPSSAPTDTIQSSTVTSTLPLLASKNETLLSAEWPQRCPKSGDFSTFNNSLAFMLMCAPAASHEGDRGQASGRTDYRRSTHYHLHDDDDFTWTRAATYTSRPAQVQSLPYRTSRNGTAFPYPLRGSDVSAARNSNFFRPRGRNVTATSSRNGSQPNRDVPVVLEGTAFSKRPKPYFGGETRTTKSTTDKRYADVILGAAAERPASSRQRQRWAYRGYYREVARQFPHTDVKRYDAVRDRAAGQRAATPADNGENRQRSRLPDKRAAISSGFSVTEEKYRRPLPPAKMDLLKSIISIKALVDEARSSGCKDALRCNANDARNSDASEKVVVRNGQPSEDDEYEYYYVDDDATSQRPLDRHRRSVTTTS
ncbi:uncharacterized protein [Dermacentor andersoni]|uniref:uncharacterized protein n=1 Tax=Dermacentor andersoni TaxID=34620 RepID=UPI002415F358|nr:mucin-19-like [Dermacentor andersoni]